MNSKFLAAIALIVSLSCHGHANADVLPTVYGFQLGSQPNLLDCDDPAVRDMTKPPGLIIYKVACSVSYGFTTPERVIVAFPPDETPALAEGGKITLNLHEGSLQAISWSTKGVYDAETILEALMKKFGKPTRSAKTPVENAQGRKFLSWSVTWKKSGYLVSYESISFLQQINHGLVRITTDAAEKRRLLIEEQTQASKKHPL